MISLCSRALTANHLSAVLELDRLCFGGLWSEAGYRRELESPNSDLRILEVVAPDVPPQVIGVGCSWAILAEAHITLLGIAPAYQRQGLGQWLLCELLMAARDRGLTHATLEVRQSNEPAIHLYKKLDFKIAGERRRYYDNGENALILWRSGLQDQELLAMVQAQQRWFRDRLQQRGWSFATTPQSLSASASP